MKLIAVFLMAISLIQCKKARENKVESNIQEQTVAVKDEDLTRWREIIYREFPSTDLRDLPNPFLSPKIQREIDKEIGNAEKTTPLELVGIVEKNGKRLALLQDITQKGYIVKTGDRLGESKIKEIGTDYIVIEEIIKDADGKKSVRTRTITLRKE